MRSLWSSGRMAGVLAFMAVLSACGGNQEEPIEDLTARQIFERAEFELENSRRADEAARLFGEVERLYPYSEYAKRALIMQTFAYHRDRDYENSRATAQRYIDFYPASEDAAYAQYLLALGYYDQIEDVGRDQALTFEALQSLRTVIERYPESDFARSAMLKFDLAFDHLAGKEMEVGRYYLKHGHLTAAINRFRLVVEEFQTTSHVAEALHRLVESYLALGFAEEAQTAGAILGHNFRSSGFYEDSHALLTGQGLEPRARGNGWLARLYRQMIRGEWL